MTHSLNVYWLYPCAFTLPMLIDFALRIIFCPSDSLLPFGFTFALRIHFCPTDSLLPYGFTFALRIHFCPTDSLLPYGFTFALRIHFCPTDSLFLWWLALYLFGTTVQTLVDSRDASWQQTASFQWQTGCAGVAQNVSSGSLGNTR